MRLALGLMMALAIPGSAFGQSQSGVVKLKPSTATMQPGAHVGAVPKPKAKEKAKPKQDDGPVNLAPSKPKQTDGPVNLVQEKPKQTDGPVNLVQEKPKQTDGPVNLVPTKPKQTDGPVNLVPSKPKQDDGPVNLKPEATLLPFTPEKPEESNATLLPFTNDSKSGSTKPATRGEARGQGTILREVLDVDQAASEADASGNDRALAAIRDALLRSDNNRARSLVEGLIADSKRRQAALDARRRDLLKRYAETQSAK